MFMDTEGIQLAFKYIHIVQVLNLPKKGNIPPKTSRFSVLNSGSDELLGIIKWYGPWRQYCFEPECAIFNEECLNNIADFLNVVSKRQYRMAKEARDEKKAPGTI